MRKTKKTLSSFLQASIDIEALQDEEDFNIIITREKFEELCGDLFQKCKVSLENALQDAKMSKDNIDKVILFGGSTRIPFIQNMIQKFFEGKQIYKKLNPHESAAYGAAI